MLTIAMKIHESFPIAQCMEGFLQDFIGNYQHGKMLIILENITLILALTKT